jgi:DNA polymerase-3 subunit gamma/tau
VPAYLTEVPPPEEFGPDDDAGPADSDDGVDPSPTDFAGVVDLAFRRGEAILGAQLTNAVHPVLVEPGRLLIRPQPGVDPRLAGQLAALLPRWTGRPWMVDLSDEPGQPTLREQKAAAKEAMRAELATHPVVAKVLDLFPGAEIDTVVELQAPTPEPATDAAGPSPDPDGVAPPGHVNEA